MALYGTVPPFYDPEIPIDDIPSKSQLVYGTCLMLLLRDLHLKADGQVLHQLYVLLFMLTGS